MKEIKGGSYYVCSLSASWFVYDETHPEGGYFVTGTNAGADPCEGTDSECRAATESGCKDFAGYGDSSFSCSVDCRPL